MQHPLRSLSGTPDSSTGWDAVDREIEELARQSRSTVADAIKAGGPAGDQSSRQAPPRAGEGDHDLSDDTEDLHRQVAEYNPRPDPAHPIRTAVLLACACCLSIGRYGPANLLVLACLRGRRTTPLIVVHHQQSLCDVRPRADQELARYERIRLCGLR